MPPNYRRKTIKFAELRALDPALAERVEATILGSLAASVVPITLEDLEIARRLVSGELQLSIKGKMRGAESQHARAALGRVVRKWFNESEKTRQSFLNYVSKQEALVSEPSAVVLETASPNGEPKRATYYDRSVPADLICPECGKGPFGSPQAIGVHLVRLHGRVPSRVLRDDNWRRKMLYGKKKCPFCDFKFKNVKAVGSSVSHIKNKHPEQFASLENESAAADRKEAHATA